MGHTARESGLDARSLINCIALILSLPTHAPGPNISGSHREGHEEIGSRTELLAARAMTKRAQDAIAVRALRTLGCSFSVPIWGTGPF